jgi:hypothetical protein
MRLSEQAAFDPAITAGDVVRAGAWDIAVAIDPLFITDGIEKATGLSKSQ